MLVPNQTYMQISLVYVSLLIGLWGGALATQNGEHGGHNEEIAGTYSGQRNIGRTWRQRIILSA